MEFVAERMNIQYRNNRCSSRGGQRTIKKKMKLSAIIERIFPGEKISRRLRENLNSRKHDRKLEAYLDI